MPANTPVQRRHKNFEATHQQMIETAVRLLSEKGADALSLSEIADLFTYLNALARPHGLLDR